MEEFARYIFEFLLLIVILGVIVLALGGSPLTRRIGKMLAPLLIAMEEKGMVGPISWMVKLALILWAALFFGSPIYHTVDDAGWIPHTKLVTVFVKSKSWIVGEYKTCYSEPTKEKTDLGELDCDLDLRRLQLGDLSQLGDFSKMPESHKLNVTFWGAIATDKNKVWNCLRRESLISRETSLTCKLQ